MHKKKINQLFQVMHEIHLMIGDTHLHNNKNKNITSISISINKNQNNQTQTSLMK